MAYEIHTLIDADNAPSNATTKYDNWYSNHNFVLTDRETGYTKNAPRQDGTLQGYDEFRVFLSLQADLQTAISDLEDQFADASWMVVNARRTDDELTQDPLRSDETYYDPDVADGLRAAVDLDFDSHTLTHDGIHYLVGGTEHSVAAGDYTFGVPDPSVTKTLYADSDGLNLNGGVEVATVEVHPGRIVSIDAAGQPTTDGAWTTEVSRGTPPSHFANESESFPDPLPSKPVERQYMSQETIDGIDTALANGNPEEAVRVLAHAVTGDDTFDPNA